MKAGIVLAAVGWLALTGCSQNWTADGSSAADAVKAADASLQKAVAAKDLDTIISFYADSAILMPTAEPLVSGKAAIKEEWTHILAIPAFQNVSKLSRVEVSSAADMAYTMGSYQSRLMGEDDKIVTEPGKWLSVWKKQSDGSWKIVVDTYNTDIPPPDHK